MKLKPDTSALGKEPQIEFKDVLSDWKYFLCPQTWETLQIQSLDFSQAEKWEMEIKVSNT